MSAVRILVMAGGTGGHVFPALAVAEELRRRGVEVIWLGTRRGLEADIAAKSGFPLHFIKIAGLRGKRWLHWLLAPWPLVVALWQSLQAVRRIDPALVLGLGGYVTGPGGVAAWLLRRPLIIHEQNAYAGFTNRCLARIAQCVLEGFPQTFTGAQVLHTGNPVRSAISALAPPAERGIASRPGLRILVVGGSLGAVAINDVVPAALAELQQELSCEVWHQTGTRHIDATRRQYAANGVQGRVEAFIDDMAQAYAWADLVICRAGALTIAELSAAGVASILVPYPHAVDDHQTANARFLVDADAAILVPQPELTTLRLTTLLRELFADRPRLRAMADAARRCAKPDATRRVADVCLEAAHV